jgi:flagellar hook protein FlgE
MLSSLSAAVSGLDNFQQDMDVIGNNIANINTTGYKDATVQFATSFSNTLASATANPVQVGTGVYDQAITNNWATGALSSTGVTTDLAINGNGFFEVADASGNKYVTQDGSFSLDPNGNLVTAGGQFVQGLTTTGTVGNIQIAAPTGSTLNSYTINSQGVITMNLTNNTTGATSTATAQIYLQTFEDPQALVSQGSNLYNNQANAGASALGAPGTNGTGSIVSGSLELSNVDLSSEMANLITAQRGFEANSKVVTTSDQMLQNVVNMVQG